MLRLALSVSVVIGGLAFAIADTAASTAADLDTTRVAAGSGHVIAAPARDQARARFAFDITIANLNDWLGLFDSARANARVAQDEPATRRPGASPVEIIVRDRWRTVPSTMDVESDVVYALTRSRWPAARDAGESALFDGVAWYLHSRIVETLFDRTQLTSGYSMDRVPLFGGRWIASFDWLPVSRWSAGVGRGGYGRENPLRARGAMAFATLERYLTWPVLQGALRAWVSRPAGAAGLDAAAQAIGDAAGQDLRWFFAFAFNPAQTVNYAVRSVTPEPAGDCAEAACYRTRVVVERRGSASFSGSTRMSDGPYQSGEAMEIEVAFVDRGTVLLRWDGRDEAKSFDVESASPPAAVSIDPEQKVVLDENRLDNTLIVNPQREMPVSRWVARWLLWFQDAMLISTI